MLAHVRKKVVEIKLNFSVYFLEGVTSEGVSTGVSDNNPGVS